MTPKIPKIIVECHSQEAVEELINGNRRVVVLYYSYSMPWGKISEHKMYETARALESGNITTIPFALVNYAEFYDENGSKVDIPPATQVRYVAYVEGKEHISTSNSTELEGMVTSLL
ncbi:hypothetical protein BGZ95_005665 [Linnemannia exigua]|uniref:Thioredoxin domain-containing protein n=1 Tax=Linnemannia exigua TaxID=604196 RepID=A0AAD4H1F9_9FUNG|nr:hypothetical protein BGZ95_005665 [Linnemannia exigua]